jgi:Arylsulfotransferase (ASST)
MKNTRVGSRPLRLAVLAAIAGSLLAAGGAPAAAPGGFPSFKVTPTGLLNPGFAWQKRDYVVRCTQGDAVLLVKGAQGWRAKVGKAAYRPGGFTAPLRSGDGRRTVVTFRKAGEGTRTHRFHLRCLPADFPPYAFERLGPGGPPYFTLQMDNRYAVIVNDDGVPVWWYQAHFDPYNVDLQPDGTISFTPIDNISLQKGDYEVRTLSGRLLRIIKAEGAEPPDVHELQLLGSGNYLLGMQYPYIDDTSAFGGSANSLVLGIQILELTPDGQIAYRWASGDHIAVSETPQRWWDDPLLDREPYDTSHWNSVELIGKDRTRMLLSFRHLDAVYMVNRKTGAIIWKLGGTPTPQSLDVIGDPHEGPTLFGGQHDARIHPNGTISIYDNRTGLGEPPRVVRYRIDEDAGTATLVQQFADPEIPISFCCGSARRIPHGEWLVGWGGFGVVGAYDRSGAPIFRFNMTQTPVGQPFTYRAYPAAEGEVDPVALRRAMDKLARRGGA